MELSSALDAIANALVSGSLRKALSYKALMVAMGADATQTSASATSEVLVAHEAAVDVARKACAAPLATVGQLTRVLTEGGHPRLAHRLPASVREPSPIRT